MANALCEDIECYRFTPVGVASLIATVLAKTQNLHATFQQLAMFIVAAMLGLVLFMFVIIPLAYFILIRSSPCTFFFNLLRPLMITFATASSYVVRPRCSHHRTYRSVSPFFFFRLSFLMTCLCHFYPV